MRGTVIDGKSIRRSLGGDSVRSTVTLAIASSMVSSINDPRSQDPRDSYDQETETEDSNIVATDTHNELGTDVIPVSRISISDTRTTFQSSAGNNAGNKDDVGDNSDRCNRLPNEHCTITS